MKPGYEQKSFPPKETRGTWRTVVAPEAKMARSRFIRMPVWLLLRCRAGEQATYSLKPGRYAWVQVATGSVTLNGNALQAGDGAAVSDETKLTVKATEPSELLLFDLA